MKITIHDIDSMSDLPAAIVGLDLADFADLSDLARATAPTQQTLPYEAGTWLRPGPVSYAPCPNCGQHERLTDRWMCWSDAHTAPTGAVVVGSPHDGRADHPRR